jgi:hypothetical protein
MVGYTSDSGFSGSYNLGVAGSVGIGTSSPGSKLEVKVGNIRINNPQPGGTAGTESAMLLGSQRYDGSFDRGIAGIWHYVETGSTFGQSGGLIFKTSTNDAAATEKMRLDSAGNLGLGVTPSAAVTNNKFFTINGSTSWSGYNSGSVYAYSLWGNAAAGISLNGGKASEFTWDSSSGAFVWRQTPSSTAGVALSGSVSAMTLDASGNLGVGSTSPTSKLQLSSTVSSAGTVALTVTDSTNSLNCQLIRTGSAYSYAGVGALETWLYSQGTSNISIGPDGAGAVKFVTNGSERARIDSSGNLLVGTTSALPGIGNTNGGGEIYVGGGSGAQIITSNSSDYSAQFNRNTTTGGIVAFRSGGTVVGSISYNGTTTVLNPTSDVRLKENIVDAGSALQKINSIRIRSFNWKANNHFTDFGVIAQELYEVAPECVTVGSDEVNEQGTLENPWCAQPYVLVPALVKAMQEQQTLIESLTTRLSALESK